MTGLQCKQTVQDQAPCCSRDDVLVVTDLEVLRLVSDPFRVQILELMREAPRTVKELAEELNIPSTRLYYHMNLLESHGLIRVASTRIVSGIVEKRYEVTAARLSVDRSLLSPGDGSESGLDTHLSFVLDEAKAEIRRSHRAGLVDASSQRLADGGLVLGRVWFRLRQEQAEELDQRLGELLEEFKTKAAQEEGSHLIDYELLVGLYPTTGTVIPPDDRTDT
jgi:DNA-binding transcriptional ArsR family regulator